MAVEGKLTRVTFNGQEFYMGGGTDPKVSTKDLGGMPEDRPILLEDAQRKGEYITVPLSTVLTTLITQIEARGAHVLIQYDADALIYEGREVIKSVCIRGLPGVWPLPLDPARAVEYMAYILAAP